MDQHRVDRMSADGHTADDGFFRHYALLSRLKSELSTMIPSLTLPSLIITLSFLSGCSGPQSILNPAGPSALAVSRLWWGMFGFSVTVLLVVMTLWIYAMRRKPRPLTEAQADRINQSWIIGGGLVLPIAGIVALLSFSIPMGYRMLPLPVAGQSVPHIDVIGHQWWWEVRYPDTDIVLINELHLPAGTPVDIHVTSSDVIHSFWVPRLAGKIDMIPGRTNVLRIEADAPGQLLGKCAEFCGVGHAHMLLEVQVHTPEDYEAWLEAYEYE
ncbi:cytochrome c oxidase subunit II [Methylotuvimicrobium buryatense]|uniref:Cytochrome aa3 subunit 2 n=2 Tax=Methylotuvimicrobium buryatense TaxID=95641 RepID=A0A4P9UPR6_METBY|nr:cytochrome c oxidase subunit II [Methylotuvimicrobium buryatense]